MKTFKFVVKSEIIVTANSEDVFSAKRNLQKNLHYLALDLLKGCYISDGEEIKIKGEF